MASRPYEAQVAPGRTPDLTPAGPDAFGASIGRAVSGLGDAVQRLDLVQRQVRRNEELADSALALETVLQGTAEYERLDRDGAVEGSTPSAIGHQERVLADFDKRAQSLMEGVTDPDVRRNLELRIAQNRRAIDGRAYATETVRRADYATRQHETTTNMVANRVAISDDPVEIETALADLDEMIGGYAMPEAAKQALRDWTRATVKGAVLKGLVGRDPARAQTLIDAGGFNDLDPNAIDRARGEIGVEQRRMEAEAARAQAAARADVRERLNILDKQLATGVPVDAALLEQAQSQATAAGLDAQAYDIGVARIRNGLNRELASASPTEIDARAKALRAKIARDGGNAKVSDQVALNHIDTLLAQRSREYATDPWSAAARTGVAMPELDPDDPQALAARAQAVQQARGRGIDVPFYSDEEATQRARTYQSGLAGRLQVFDELLRLPEAERTKAAQQVAPGSRALAYAAQLRPQVGRLAMIGTEALKANSALLPQAEAREIFRDHVRGALDAVPGMVTAVMETAGLIYAGWASQNGALGEFDESAYRTAVNMALRGNVQAGEGRGGVGEWGGWRVMLPEGMSQREFDARLLNKDALRSASSDPRGPVDRAGNPVYWVPFRRQFHPVAIAPGRYRFETAQGQVLMGADRKPWTIDVWKLPPVQPRASAPVRLGVPDADGPVVIR